MVSRKARHALSRLAVLLGALGAGGAAQAIPFNEIGDAGDLISTAQVVTGAGALTSISGEIDATGDATGDKDVYRIFISDPSTFSAEVTTTTPADDTKLYLLDIDGFGILGDDDSGAGVLSLLPAGNPAITGLSAGLYHLAIADFNFIPVSVGGDIFPSGNLVGPTGPGGGSPMIGWNSSNNEQTYTYTISLTGASFAAVPAPATALILGAGLIGLGLGRRVARRS